MKFQVLLVVLCKAAHTVASEVNVVRLETGLNPNAQGAAWAPQTHNSPFTCNNVTRLVPRSLKSQVDFGAAPGSEQDACSSFNKTIDAARTYVRAGVDRTARVSFQGAPLLHSILVLTA